MKFKAFLTDNGVYLLDKRILPALDKMGKICHIYLTHHHFCFLHNLLNGDGVQSIAQLRKDSLFDDYKFSSLNDKIAFSLDLTLLQRALRSIVATGTDDLNRYQIKLVKKLTPHSHHAMPFLTFETQGYRSAVIQDVPISRPLGRGEVAELEAALESAQVVPSCLVQLPDLSRLMSFVDRMKHVGDALSVSISKYGDLHLGISTSLITLGAEFRKLAVLGEKGDAPVGDQGVGAQARMQRAVVRGDAMSVQVSVKHFFKSLQCQLAKPDCGYFGIASHGSCLTVIFEFFIPGTRLRDNGISFYCRIPVLDPGSS